MVMENEDVNFLEIAERSLKLHFCMEMKSRNARQVKYILNKNTL